MRRYASVPFPPGSKDREQQAFCFGRHAEESFRIVESALFSPNCLSSASVSQRVDIVMKAAHRRTWYWGGFISLTMWFLCVRGRAGQDRERQEF